jgi:hypothetical protein
MFIISVLCNFYFGKVFDIGQDFRFWTGGIEFVLNSVNSLIRLIQVQTIALGTKADTGLADKACAV